MRGIIRLLTFAAVGVVVCGCGSSSRTMTSPVPSHRRGPDSLEEWLATENLIGASVERFRQVTERERGASVRWRLLSWGGEGSTVGFQTPDGPLPASIGRVRFISTTLGGGDLSTVDAAGYPVVCCLAQFANVGTFVRNDGRLERSPEMNAIVTIEGTVWGATDEGGATLWLRNCAVVEEESSAPPIPSETHETAQPAPVVLDAVPTCRIDVVGPDQFQVTLGFGGTDLESHDVSRRASAADMAWLEFALYGIPGTELVITVADAVPYAIVVAVMDAAVAAGHVDVSISGDEQDL